MRTNELIFMVKIAPENGGYTARALGESIFVEAAYLWDLWFQIQDALKCHFEDDQPPKRVEFRFVRETGVAEPEYFI